MFESEGVRLFVKALNFRYNISIINLSLQYCIPQGNFLWYHSLYTFLIVIIPIMDAWINRL